MGLDIYLYDADDKEVMSMNWLRNPFGLCRWAEDNIELDCLPSDTTLWYVCNHWSYSNGNNIDRKLFLDVVKAYKEAIDKLTTSYFYFNVSSYQQFVEPLRLAEPYQVGGHVVSHRVPNAIFKEGMIGIPVDQYGHRFNLGSCCTTKAYKKWFNKLHEFAKLLQDDSLRFYCSN